jgi:hypothetical protein
MDIAEIGLYVNIIILVMNTVAAVAAVIAILPRKGKGRHRRQ